jgi:hypothetical protein
MDDPSKPTSGNGGFCYNCQEQISDDQVSKYGGFCDNACGLEFDKYLNECHNKDDLHWFNIAPPKDQGFLKSD